MKKMMVLMVSCFSLAGFAEVSCIIPESDTRLEETQSFTPETSLGFVLLNGENIGAAPGGYNLSLNFKESLRDLDRLQFFAGTDKISSEDQKEQLAGYWISEDEIKFKFYKVLEESQSAFYQTCVYTAELGPSSYEELSQATGEPIPVDDGDPLPSVFKGTYQLKCSGVDQDFQFRSDSIDGTLFCELH